MISNALKRAYYLTLRYPMRLNGRIYKAVRCPTNGLKVHLGPGQRNYIEGWLNVDANIVTARIDLWADFSSRLPFKDGSVDAFYSHHVFEHLPDSSQLPLFAEMFRCLRPGGGIRIAAPHLGNACRKYVEGDSSWFTDFPDKRASLGGRFTNFIFCRGEHLTALDETYLAELASEVGFTGIEFCRPGQETFLADAGVDERVLSREFERTPECPHTVILEARRPVVA